MQGKKATATLGRIYGQAKQNRCSKKHRDQTIQWSRLARRCKHTVASPPLAGHLDFTLPKESPTRYEQTASTSQQLPMVYQAKQTTKSHDLHGQ
eukprot:1669066-Amphidinium_carterae.1